jgi:hypothetical protein
MGLASNETRVGYRPRIGLFLARFCTSAWIGAATLFVIVGVKEVTRAGFDSATKDALVAVRFPAYYVCGAVLICVGWLGTWVASHSANFPKLRRISSLLLLSLVLSLMFADYIWIYQPLLQMVTPPGQAKPASFMTLHEASKWMNLVELMLCLVAATLLNWPVVQSQIQENS